MGPVLCGCGQVAGIPCLNVGQSRQAAGHGGHRYCSPVAMAVTASVDARSVAAKDVAPAAIAVAVERSRAAIVDSTAPAAAWTALTAAPVAWPLETATAAGGAAANVSAIPPMLPAAACSATLSTSIDAMSQT